MNNKFLANLMVYIYATLTGFAPVRLPYASFVVNNIVPLQRIERLSILPSPHTIINANFTENEDSKPFAFGANGKPIFANRFAVKIKITMIKTNSNICVITYSFYSVCKHLSF